MTALLQEFPIISAKSNFNLFGARNNSHLQQPLPVLLTSIQGDTL